MDYSESIACSQEVLFLKRSKLLESVLWNCDLVACSLMGPAQLEQSNSESITEDGRLGPYPDYNDVMFDGSGVNIHPEDSRLSECPLYIFVTYWDEVGNTAKHRVARVGETDVVMRECDNKRYVGIPLDV
jgi:hypothetical protein